jgi:UDP:flavonoid glycosyltransferase YjiC (YdhE family)
MVYRDAGAKMGAMRVLFTTTPGWGHVHPMVPLARAFADRGDDVLWAAAAEVAPRLEKAGFRVEAAGPGLAESFGELNRRFPEIEALPPPERPDFMFPRLFGSVRTAPMLADVLPIARGFGPAVVVSDQAEFAGHLAAAIIGAPSVTHSFGGLLPRHRVEAAGHAVAPLWEQRGMAPPPYGGSYEHLYLDIYPPSLKAADAAHVPSVQPLRPVAFATGDEAALPDWVTDDASAPLVYVTFGTVFNTDHRAVTTVVEALRELPLRVLVTVGPAADPDVLGPQPANVHVARYIPQTQLLPYCTAVVSHAGSGTLLAALARGLPQLCLPQAADQFGNAAACAGAGAGLALQLGTVTVDSVRASVEKLLADPAFREAAETIAGEMRQMPGPGEVAEILAARFG